ncbi:asparaginase [Streptomyces roseicoloratus]|uniref:asparaginase n=1 Tax=Streptomyces roseicoloratus TaxID=2508722 RepID=A0ABY9S6A9_9ACTN|nr:asparaginase [Streptomyces roseicoloratus]WMX48525.1 asparaginase [Streptomyces roseicoloratus]
MKWTRDARPRRIVVISTGGTIASRWTGSGYAADASGDDVVATAAVPDHVDVEVLDLFNVNSSRMTTDRQLRLLAAVHETLADPGVDGIVVTHGTDTLEESAFFLDLHHSDPRPVVFTGAQRPFGTGDGDGPGNLYDALQVAATVHGLGVLVVFDGLVHAARGTVKTRTLDSDPFADPSGRRVGRLGFGQVDVEREPERPAPLPLPEAAIAAITSTAGAADARRVLPRVDIVMHHSDNDPVLFEAAVAAGARGIVLVGTGAGNATPEIADAVARAVRDGVHVVLSTRVASGPVAEVYTGGGAVDLAAAGAVLAGTLRPGQARMALLAGLLAESTSPERRNQLLRTLLEGPVRAESVLAVAH